MGRLSVISITAALVVAAGCGSDDDGGTSESPTDASSADAPVDEVPPEPASEDVTTDDASVEPADESAADDAATPAGAGSATVTFEGTTYRFAQIEPGPDDDWYVFCTTIGDALQAVMRQVDEAGNPAQGELSVILVEPGGAWEQTGDPPEVEVSVDNERFLRYFEGDPIVAPADGRSGGGTVTLRESGAMDPTTGEVETTPVEVTLQVSC